MRTPSFDHIISRRSALAGIGAGGLVIATAGRHAAANLKMNGSLAGHPLVGSWITQAPEPEPSPTSGPALNFFSSDGIFSLIDPLRGNSIGSWEATGERTALLTLVFIAYSPDDSTLFQSLAVGRDSIEVAFDGASFTGQAELEFRSAEGTTIDGPFGPVPFSGRRILVEQMVTTLSSPATPAL